MARPDETLHIQIWSSEFFVEPKKTDCDGDTNYTFSLSQNFAQVVKCYIYWFIYVTFPFVKSPWMKFEVP